MPGKQTLIVVLLWLALCGVLLAQTLTSLKNQPPDGAGIGYLLTDCWVIFQGNNESDWAMLTPDDKGSYVNGTWKTIAKLRFSATCRCTLLG